MIGAAVSRFQSMARSACFIDGRRRPRAYAMASESCSGRQVPDLTSPLTMAVAKVKEDCGGLTNYDVSIF